MSLRRKAVQSPINENEVLYFDKKEKQQLTLSLNKSSNPE